MEQINNIEQRLTIEEGCKILSAWMKRHVSMVDIICDGEPYFPWCMVYYLPEVSDKFVFNEARDVVGIEEKSWVEQLRLIGIPMSYALARVLTLPNTQSDIGLKPMHQLSKYEEVAALWMQVANMIEKRELDRLVFHKIRPQ